jgi:hypothetical protein
MTIEDGVLGLAIDIPEPDGFVSGSRRQKSAIGTERNTGDNLFVSFQDNI